MHRHLVPPPIIGKEYLFHGNEYSMEDNKVEWYVCKYFVTVLSPIKGWSPVCKVKIVGLPVLPLPKGRKFMWELGQEIVVGTHELKESFSAANRISYRQTLPEI